MTCTSPLRSTDYLQRLSRRRRPLGTVGCRNTVGSDAVSGTASEGTPCMTRVSLVMPASATSEIGS